MFKAYSIYLLGWFLVALGVISCFGNPFVGLAIILLGAWVRDVKADQAWRSR